MIGVKFPTVGRAYIPTPHIPRSPLRAKMKFRFTDRGHRIKDYMLRVRTTFLKRAGGMIKAWTIRQFKVVSGDRPARGLPRGGWESTPPNRPHMHTFNPKGGKGFLRRAITWVMTIPGKEIIVGPRYSVAGHWGWKHEHGKTDRAGTYFPPRPFMEPSFRRWYKYGRPILMKKVIEWAKTLT